MVDVVRFVSGISLSPLNTTRANGSKIRGISTFSFSDGFESSVSTVVDGVVLGREAQGFADFLDVRSIEVIKGPQGTLYGKNASAGVINIQTNDPEFAFGGSADATYGSFNETKVRGTLTGPLVSDKLAIRLTGTYNKRDGVFERHPDLRVISMEHGCIWLPGWLKMIDFTANVFKRLRGFAELPSVTAMRHIEVAPFAGEPVGWVIEQVGAQMLVYASDYPHPEGSGDSIGKFEEAMTNCDKAKMDAFYYGNMAEVMNMAAA